MTNSIVAQQDTPTQAPTRGSIRLVFCACGTELRRYCADGRVPVYAASRPDAIGFMTDAAAPRHNVCALSGTVLAPGTCWAEGR